MNYTINFLKNNYLITFAISPLILLILTFHNPYYSDDYQTIIGLKLFNDSPSTKLKLTFRMLGTLFFTSPLM